MKRFLVVSIMIICLLSSFAFAEGIEDLKLDQYFDSLLISSSNSKNAVSMDAPIRVQLNGDILDFTDANGNVANPKIINNRTMVPMRKIFEIFDATIDWNEEAKTVIAKTETKEITLTIGSTSAVVKDLATSKVDTMTLDQAPVISENRTLVPVRFIAEGLDKEVGWDNSQRAVIIIDEEVFVEQLRSEVPTLETLFNLNIKEMGAYASHSDIEGKLSYLDSESNNKETINISGTANIEVDAKENMSADIAFNTTGSDGQIMSSLRQQNYDNLDAKLVLLDGKVYLGYKQDGEYQWTEASDSISSVEIPSTPSTLNKVTSYEEAYKLIRSYIGDLDIDSFDNLKQIISMLKVFINPETVHVLDNELIIDLDLLKILNSMGDYEASFPVSELRIKMDISLDGGTITAESVEFGFKANSQDSAEDLEVGISINTTYESNGNISIKAPNM